MQLASNIHWGVRNNLLSGLPALEFELMRPLLSAVQLSERVVIQEVKRRIQHVYFIESGIVSSRILASGCILETVLVDIKGAVGLSLSLGNDQSESQSIVIARGTSLRIDASELKMLLARRPLIKDHFLKYIHARMVHSSQTALCGVRHELEGRLACWLCQAHKALAGRAIPVTHSDLSIMLGLRRPSVTEALARFENRGLLRNTRGLIEVDDHDTLSRTACGCIDVIENAYKAARDLCASPPFLTSDVYESGRPMP